MFMKKHLLFICILSLFVSCFELEDNDSVSVSFYVKNTAENPISFSTTIWKFSQINGMYKVTSDYTVNSGDSVLARKATYSSDVIEPNKWFESFVITPVEGIEMSNPNLVENWVKYIRDGLPVYVFTLNQ